MECLLSRLMTSLLTEVVEAENPDGVGVGVGAQKQTEIESPVTAMFLGPGS